ncbi:hypothetical protein N1851_023586 [Merluccius polli]|uniref:Myelin basic protein n=1 Tax=Merluccius polli TaxID=89951 RepID=A0AA47MFY3_MERPO|nr:hypothetical protein N1851_023586 [Merluccius polli]
MATTSSSGLSKKKKNAPGLMDQLNTFFGGDKKKRSKGSFRGHLAASPQQAAAARRRPNESAVAHFFRNILINHLFQTSSPRAESAKSPLRRRRDQSTLSRLFNLVRMILLLLDQKPLCLSLTVEKPRPALPLNAGAPSSKISTDNHDPDPPETGRPNPERSDGEEGCIQEGLQDLNKC